MPIDPEMWARLDEITRGTLREELNRTTEDIFFRGRNSGGFYTNSGGPTLKSSTLRKEWDKDWLSAVRDRRALESDGGRMQMIIPTPLG